MSDLGGIDRVNNYCRISAQGLSVFQFQTTRNSIYNIISFIVCIQFLYRRTHTYIGRTGRLFPPQMADKASEQQIKQARPIITDRPRCIYFK